MLEWRRAKVVRKCIAKRQKRKRNEVDDGDAHVHIPSEVLHASESTVEDVYDNAPESSSANEAKIQTFRSLTPQSKKDQEKVLSNLDFLSSMSSKTFFDSNGTTPTKFNFPALMLHRFLRLEGIRMARSSFELCPSSHQESKEADTDSSSCLSPPFMVQRDDPFAISITNHVTSFPAVTEVSDLLDRTACGTRVGILDGVRVYFLETNRIDTLKQRLKRHKQSEAE